LTLPRFRLLDLWLPIAVVVFDQATKAVVRATLPLHSKVTIVPGLVDFTHVRNTGAAFGILNAADFPFKTVVIALVATVALIGVALYAANLAPHQRVARAGLALIIGGAAGTFVFVTWPTSHAAFPSTETQTTSPPMVASGSAWIAWVTGPDDCTSSATAGSVIAALKMSPT